MRALFCALNSLSFKRELSARRDTRSSRNRMAPLPRGGQPEREQRFKPVEADSCAHVRMILTDREYDNEHLALDFSPEAMPGSV